jgi:Holliday junction resolvasome RuvABC endonuclease subunit
MKLAAKNNNGGLSLLSNDPGYTNFGWSNLIVKRGKVQIVECGMLTGMPTDLKVELTDQKQAFKNAWTKLVKRCAPDVITAERYLSQRQGLSNELVNYMIGAMWYTSNVPFHVYNAATWKARIKKILGGEKDAIEQFYKRVGSEAKGGAPDHVVDATLNGLYYLERDHAINIMVKLKNLDKLAEEIRQAYYGTFPK